MSPVSKCAPSLMYLSSCLEKHPRKHRSTSPSLNGKIFRRFHKHKKKIFFFFIAQTSCFYRVRFLAHLRATYSCNELSSLTMMWPHVDSHERKFVCQQAINNNAVKLSCIAIKCLHRMVLSNGLWV